MSKQGNRFGITTRFNIAERVQLRDLCIFWKLTEKEVLRLAFEQLANATTQMAKRLNEEKKNENESTSVDSVVTTDRSSDAVSTEADTAAAAAAGDSTAA